MYPVPAPDRTLRAHDLGRTGEPEKKKQKNKNENNCTVRHPKTLIWACLSELQEVFVSVLIVFTLFFSHAPPPAATWHETVQHILTSSHEISARA